MTTAQAESAYVDTRHRVAREQTKARPRWQGEHALAQAQYRMRAGQAAGIDRWLAGFRHGAKYAGIDYGNAHQRVRAVMGPLFARWLSLLSFRSGPADLPHAPALLGSLLALAFALDWFGSQAMQPQVGEPWWGLTRVAIGMSLVWALLASSGRAARFVQTATALVMVAIAANVAFLPILFLIWPLPVDPAALSPRQALLGLLLMPLLVWFLSVRASILRSALETAWMAAFFLSLLLLFAEALLSLSLIRMLQ